MVKKLSRKDEKFLSDLEEKCHHVSVHEFTPNMSGEPFNVGRDNYKEIKPFNDISNESSFLNIITTEAE